MALARKGDLVLPFVELGTPMVDLLDQLTGEREFTARVERLVTAFGAPPDRSAREAEAETRAETRGARGRRRDPRGLTNRELDVLELLALRLQNKEIADPPGDLVPDREQSPQTDLPEARCPRQKRGGRARRGGWTSRPLPSGLTRLRTCQTGLSALSPSFYPISASFRGMRGVPPESHCGHDAAILSGSRQAEPQEEEEPCNLTSRVGGGP